MRYTGPGAAVIKDTSLITSVKTESDHEELLLAPNADPQEVLRRLIDSGATILRFELIEPSLHDIFKDKVREANE